MSILVGGSILIGQVAHSGPENSYSGFFPDRILITDALLFDGYLFLSLCVPLFAYEASVLGYSVPLLAPSPEHAEHLFRKELSMEKLVSFSQSSALKPGGYRICFTRRVISWPS